LRIPAAQEAAGRTEISKKFGGKKFSASHFI
jgi:hypothetical protein